MKRKNARVATTPTTGLALATGCASAAGVWSTITWVDDSSLSFISNTNVTHSGDFGSAASINGHTFESITIPSGPGGFGIFSSPYSGRTSPSARRPIRATPSPSKDRRASAAARPVP